jgi:hypothetical protein
MIHCWTSNCLFWLFDIWHWSLLRKIGAPTNKLTNQRLIKTQDKYSTSDWSLHPNISVPTNQISNQHFIKTQDKYSTSDIDHCIARSLKMIFCTHKLHQDHARYLVILSHFSSFAFCNERKMVLARLSKTVTRSFLKHGTQLLISRKPKYVYKYKRLSFYVVIFSNVGFSDSHLSFSWRYMKVILHVAFFTFFNFIYQQKSVCRLRSIEFVNPLPVCRPPLLQSSSCNLYLCVCMCVKHPVSKIMFEPHA